MWLGHERRQRRKRRRWRQEHADHEGDHRQPAGLEGADRRLQEGEPGRHDQGDVRADRPAPDRAARAARRGRRAGHVRRVARQRQRDVGEAARPERPARGPQRRGLGQVDPGGHAAAARRRRQDLHLVAEHHPDRRHLQQAGLQGRGRRQAPGDLSRVPRREREDQEGGQDPGRGRPPDALGHAADPLRDRPGDRLRRRPEPGEGHAGRQEVVHQLRVGRGLQALPRPREARLLQPQPERHHLRAADGDGCQRQGGDGDPGDRDAARLPRRGEEPGRHRHLPLPGERQGRRAEDRGRHLGRARRERQDAEDGRREGVREVARRAAADGARSPRAATRSRSSPPATSSIRSSSRSSPS